MGSSRLDDSHTTLSINTRPSVPQVLTFTRQDVRFSKVDAEMVHGSLWKIVLVNKFQVVSSSVDGSDIISVTSSVEMSDSVVPMYS